MDLHPMTSMASTATHVPVAASSPPQTSGLFRLPGEIRNQIYSHVLGVYADKPPNFESTLPLSSTSHQLRAEFRSYVFVKSIVTLDLRKAGKFFAVFYPDAEHHIIEQYLGKFKFFLPHQGGFFTGSVAARAKDWRGVCVDLLPIVKVLRASPHIRFWLAPESLWLCSRKSLKYFLDYARNSDTFVVAEILNSLTLRIHESQMVQRVWETFWIVDVGLQRGMEWIYETLGFMEWVKMRMDSGWEGVTMFVEWDKDEVEVLGRRKKLARKVRNVLEIVKKRLEEVRTKGQKAIWYGRGSLFWAGADSA